MINNSEPAVPLPDDIIKATENARNKITILEAEISRLTKLKGQVEKEIISTNSEKQYIESLIPSLEKQRDELVTTVEELEKKVEKANTELSNLKSSQTVIEGVMAEKRGDLEAKLSDLRERTEIVKKGEFELQKARELFEKDKQELAQKKSKLESAISQL